MEMLRDETGHSDIHEADNATEAVSNGEEDSVQIEIDEILPGSPDPIKEQPAKFRVTNYQQELEMEEGELSSDEVYDNNGQRLFGHGRIETLTNRGSSRQPIQITIQNKEAAKLPVRILKIMSKYVVGGLSAAIL